MVESGVLSSWEALDTNWLRVWSSRSNRSHMELNASANCENSLRPRTETRLDRSPWVMREMPWLSSSMGRVKMRETMRLSSSTESATSNSQMAICRCICVRLWYTSCAIDE